MQNLKLKDIDAIETTYSGIDRVAIPKADGSGDALFVDSNNITAQLLESLDPDFVADNIKKNVDLFGRIGTFEGGGGGDVEYAEGVISFSEITGDTFKRIEIETGLSKAPSLFYATVGKSGTNPKYAIKFMARSSSTLKNGTNIAGGKFDAICGSTSSNSSYSTVSNSSIEFINSKVVFTCTNTNYTETSGWIPYTPKLYWKAIAY